MTPPKTRDHLIVQIENSRSSPVVELAGGGFRWGPHGGEVIFPGVPKPGVFVIGHWTGREALIREMGEAFYTLYRTCRHETRVSQRVKLRIFLKWLATWDPTIAVQSACDISSQMLDAYLNALRHNEGISMTTRRKRWNLFRAVVRQMASSPQNKALQNLRLAENPFPWANRTEQPVEPLTINEVQALLETCEKQMQAAWIAFANAGLAYAGPTVSDLYPFLYIAGLLTTMNPDTLRGLKVKDLSEDTNGRLIIRGDKFRAGHRQQVSLPASTDSTLDGKVIFYRVKHMTDSIRRQVSDEMAEHLWLARKGHKTAKEDPVAEICTLYALEGSSTHHYSRKLGALAGIPNLNLRRMRATGAELIRILDTGVPVTALLGNTSAVAERSYKSAGARSREHTALARQMEARTRYARTKGARDVRDRHGAAQSGATPGFSCMDPFSPPPELKQQPGLCTAFLACPSCPQSGINVDSPETAADLLSMRAALEDARHRLSPTRWRELYSTAYEGIGAALKRMSKRVLNEAAHLPLRVLPELE
jgi:hypothetical protein